MLNLEFSPVKGPEGNIEYLLYLRNCVSEGQAQMRVGVKEVVDEAHEVLG